MNNGDCSGLVEGGNSSAARGARGNLRQSNGASCLDRRLDCKSTEAQTQENCDDHGDEARELHLDGL